MEENTPEIMQEEPKPEKKPKKPKQEQPKQEQVATEPSRDLATTDDKLITEAVNFINQKSSELLYKAHVEIGKYLLEKFFENDINLAFSHDPKKTVSFEKLCKRDDLAVHPVTLARMVKVAAQEQLLIDHKIDTDSLHFSHKVELLKLTDPGQKVELAKKCIEESLSTRGLNTEVKQLLLEDKSERTQKKAKKSRDIKALAANVKKLEKGLDNLKILQINFDIKELKKLSKRSQNNIRERVATVKDDVELLLADCETLLENLKEV